MTDNEIIKALEIHINEFNETGISVDNNRLDKLTLDLIDRQKAEIERLQKVNDSFTDIGKLYSEIRIEAIKEFANSLKDRIVNFPSVYPIESATLAFLNGSSHRQLEILEIIDNLAKEMVGETDDCKRSD